MTGNQAEPCNRPPAWRRKKVLAVLLLLVLICTARHLCAAFLDGVRHTVDLSFTIEWGPTYWVDHCMAALGRPGIERLCATTLDDKQYVARGAQYALAGIHAPAYAPLFIATINNPSTHASVRDSLLRNLCGMQSNQATDFIKTFVHDEKQSERDLLTVVTCSAYHADLLPLVEEITAWSHRPTLARRALCSLAQSRIEPMTKNGTVPELRKSLSDKDVHVRWMAARALGQMGTVAVPELREALGDQDKEVRSLAAVALGRIGPEAKDAVPELRLALSDNDEAIRSLAVIALGQIGPAAEDAVAKLQNVRSRDQSNEVRNYAYAALKKIAGLNKGH
jgi:hypothetical protein